MKAEILTQLDEATPVSQDATWEGTCRSWVLHWGIRNKTNMAITGWTGPWRRPITNQFVLNEGKTRRCSLRSGLWKIKDSAEESLERTSFYYYYYSCICSANLEYISVWLIYNISLSQQGVAEYLTRLGELYSVGKLGKMSQMEAEESLEEYLFQDYLLWQAFWFSVPSVEG